VRFTGNWEIVGVLLDLLSESNIRHNDLQKKSATPKKKSAKDKMNEGSKSIKSGWLYKKRDIIAGWRHRYFKLYMGRLEYYTDQNAVVPRGVIPLLGAEISSPKPCAVNGNDSHYCLTLVDKT
jgi:hypothetical protein